MLSYNRHCHHKVQEKQEDFCISSQAFLSACEDRAAAVNCGSSGSPWLAAMPRWASSAIPTAPLRKPSRTQRLESLRWTARATLSNITIFHRHRCYVVALQDGSKQDVTLFHCNLQISTSQIQRPQTVNRLDLPKLLAQANVYRHMDF